ncbi:putative elongation factor 1-gamma 2 [Microthyrium microscopicum]|uniref:Putative elongation factor 1-gamma 2 n=1 Tax=Microthyrium microscopicum TaxID=703497 RepID=A0A6A6U2L9_9PEZI|nr:putative elongation factor 1-gamma 2 [Microthyrium microscopicum]
MSFGKLYTKDDNTRTTAIQIVAKANDIDLEIVQTETGASAPADYLLYNKLGKIPTFVGADGYVLSECIAIAIYITSQNEKTTLLGKTKQDYASILKWMSFANSEILGNLAQWFAPLAGKAFYNKKQVDDAQKATLARIKVLEDYLLVNTYLVGERLTLADIFVATLMLRGFQNVFDKKFREEHVSFTRWYETVTKQPIYTQPSATFIDEAIKYTPPKKEAAPKKEAKKEAPKKAVAAAEEEEEEDKPAPKPKHPLDLLPRSTFVLDDWKRKYSNAETPEALEWFWKEVNFDEYTLWKIDYKYNEELTQVFMSSNLIGGFFARLEGSRKFIFGCASVYGTNNDSVIQGAFLIRGDNATHAFDVAPDWESYEFTKLDHTKAEDKEFVNSQWTWEKPIVVKGKEYPHADGKVFK